MEHILPSQASEGTLQPYQSLDAGLPASRTVRQYFSVVLATHFVMIALTICLVFHDHAFSLYQNLVAEGVRVVEKGEGE